MLVIVPGCYNVIWRHVVFESLYIMTAWITFHSEIGIRGEKILNTYFNTFSGETV